MVGDWHEITSAYSVEEEYQLPDFVEAHVKEEPMLFNCDRQHAKELGGPITRAFLNALAMSWWNVPLVIDTRVHMLMPDWFPCIPGWHHDDVPRTREDKQPNYSLGQDRSEHAFALINGEICPTQLATGTGNFEEPRLGQKIYELWHQQVERGIRYGKLTVTSAPSRRLILMNDRTWHQGTRAVAGGWRWFGRASRYYDKDGNPIARRNERTNEIRRQVQVYLDSPFKGW